MVVKALDGIAVAIEGAFEGIVLRAECEGSYLIDDGIDMRVGEVERLAVRPAYIFTAQVKDVGDSGGVRRARGKGFSYEIVGRPDVDGRFVLRMGRCCGSGKR